MATTKKPVRLGAYPAAYHELFWEASREPGVLKLYGVFDDVAAMNIAKRLRDMRRALHACPHSLPLVNACRDLDFRVSTPPAPDGYHLCVYMMASRKIVAALPEFLTKTS